MAPHVSTSVAIARLLDQAPHDGVSLDWLMGRLQNRSFGIVILLLALIGLAPGIATVAGILLVFPSLQMMLGRDRPTFPGFIAARSIPTQNVVRWSAGPISLLARMERIIRPRWRTSFRLTKRLVGVVIFALVGTLIWPIPFSHVIPMIVIMMISIAYLEEDGLLLLVSLAAAAVSFGVTAAMVWGAFQATGFIGTLWPGG